MSLHFLGRGLALLGAVSFAALFLAEPLSAEEKVVPVIDLHVDISYRSLYKKQPFSQGSGEYVASKLEAAGVRGVVLPLYVPLKAKPHGRSLYQLERSYAHVFRSLLETRPYSLPGCGVNRAGSEKRGVSTWLAFEGAGPLGANESEVRKWALRGVRSFGLVHSVPNSLAGSSGRRRSGSNSGLTLQGRQFVRAVARVKGLIDVSHASDEATNDAIELSLSLGRPLIATHSNARALAPHPRNLTDEQIRGIARSGGVVGVNFHSQFLEKWPGASARIKDVVAQILHLRRVGGAGAVAIGSDFEGGISAVPELSDATRFGTLATALREAGLSAAEVKRIFYGNARRVLCEK